MTTIIYSLCTLISALLLSNVTAFCVIEPSALHEVVTNANAFHIELSSIQSFLQDNIQTTNTILASVSTSDGGTNLNHLLDAYKQSLVNHPLATKMLTGATLAVCGDAIAQSRSEDPYDTRRAVSFASFDSIYRAVQHASFPAIVQQCQGQYISALLASLPFYNTIMSKFVDGTVDPTYYFGAMEQTLVSQLGIVPFFYYPVFYTITAFVQGLDKDAAVQRAKDTFIPLMKRNLLFWIPVQFIQFGYIDESLQIPFLSVAGLMWTFIISLFAGNANAKTEVKQESDLPAEMNTVTNADRLRLEKQILDAVMKETEELVEKKKELLSTR